VISSRLSSHSNKLVMGKLCRSRCEAAEVLSAVLQVFVVFANLLYHN
jgi:hypothetical protein